jgi:hypothetical protein
MSRIRSIKPSFFDDPDVGELSAEAALFFVGLLTQADKAGRLCDEPRRLKVRIRPYSDCSPEAILSELSEAGFIIRYAGSDGRALIQVRSFLKHQRPHPKEADSELEAPNLENCSVKTQSREKVVPSREKDMASKVVSGGRKESLEVGREGEGSIAAKDAPKLAADAAPLPTPSYPPPLIDGRSMRRHGQHARCYEARGLCITPWVWEELVGRIGGDPATAKARLAAWADGEVASTGQQSIGDAPDTWWRKRFAAWQGVEANPSSKPTQGVRLAGVFADTMQKLGITPETAQRPERPTLAPQRPLRALVGGES